MSNSKHPQRVAIQRGFGRDDVAKLLHDSGSSSRARCSQARRPRSGFWGEAARARARSRPRRARAAPRAPATLFWQQRSLARRLMARPALRADMHGFLKTMFDQLCVSCVCLSVSWPQHHALNYNAQKL